MDDFLQIEKLGGLIWQMLHLTTFTITVLDLSPYIIFFLFFNLFNYVSFVYLFFD